MLLLITAVRPNVWKDADYSSMQGLKMVPSRDKNTTGVEAFNYASTVEECEKIKGMLPGVFEVDTDERTFGKSTSLVIVDVKDRVGNVSEFDITPKGIVRKPARPAPASAARAAV